MALKVKAVQYLTLRSTPQNTPPRQNRLPWRRYADSGSAASVVEALDKRLARLEEEEEAGSELNRSGVSEREAPRVRDASKLRDGELPRVAIVGRPNVGKSALLNRLTKSSKAIVFDKPGITRDRLFVRAFWGRAEFMLVDTGGLPDTKVAAGLEERRHEIPVAAEIPIGVEKQVAAAVEESDMILFVVDGQEGPVGGDREILTWLRKQHSTKTVLKNLPPREL